ncbi:MAG: RNase adapter RapZ [Clostridia bacterium]|nr:RNase adapter RapZ [Clostridia bacterium]
MELLIVTGMSGAGKSHTANVLEDMGYYCVDNIPPLIIPSFLDLSYRGENPLKQVAIVTDIRGGEMFSALEEVLSRLKEQGIEYKIVFLDAATDVLVRRYKENRRKHPLSNTAESIENAVGIERERLNSIRLLADFVIDTSHISLSQLKGKLSAILSKDINDTMSVEFKSFGFKYGSDSEADLLFDVRCLPNPFYIEELKSKTGLDKQVRDYVLESEESKAFLEKLLAFVEYALPLYAKEGKSGLIVSFGCTGGKHRSVTFAETFCEYFKGKKYNCHTSHRDIIKG